MNANALLSDGLLVLGLASTGLGGWSAWRLRELGGVRRIIVEDDAAVMTAEPPAPSATPAGDPGDEYRYEIWAMNGFLVRHAADGAAPTHHTFEIRRGLSGVARRVTVWFQSGVVADASAGAGRPLGEDRRFWIRQGGLALARHLWAHGEPPTSPVVVAGGVSWPG